MLTTFAAMMLAVAPVNDDPATLLPESTLIYFGTESARAGSQASQASVMSKIMGEAEMRAFLEKPMSAADGVLKQLMEQGKTLVEANKPEDIELEMTSEFSLFDMANASDLPLGQMFFAVTKIDLGMETGVPDVGLILGLEMLEGDNLETVRKLWAGIPGEGEKRSHVGREYFVKPLPDAPVAVHLAFLDNLAVVSLSESALHGVIDRHAGETDISSLATSAAYTELVKQAKGIPKGGSAAFMRVAPMVDLVKMGLAAAMQAEGETDKIGEMMQIVDGLGIQAQEWAGGVSHRAADGVVHNTQVMKVDKNVKGLLSSMFASTRPLDLSRLEDIPATTSSVSGMSVTGLDTMYDFFDSTFKRMAPEEYEQGMGMLTEMLGDVNIRDDLFANIDGDVWSYRLPGMGFMGASAGVTTIDMKSPERFMGALEKLISIANTQFADQLGGDIALKRSVHGDHAFYELDLSRTPAGAMASMGMSPSMAIKDGELWMSFESATALRTALNGETGEGSIIDNKNFVAFLDRLKKEGGTEDLTQVAFTNVAETFGETYRSMAGMLGMMAGGMGDIPVDFSLLPSETTITQHLRETYAGATGGNEDGVVVMRSTSLFELGDFMPIIATAGLLGMAQQMGIDATSTIVETVSPIEQAQEDISQLRAGVTVYKISAGGAPNSLDDLVKPLPDYPNGCLGRPDLPLDPWGNSYNYSVNGRKWNVWSSGANGIDEGGEGDDVSRKR